MGTLKKIDICVLPPPPPIPNTTRVKYLQSTLYSAFQSPIGTYLFFISKIYKVMGSQILSWSWGEF